VNKILYCYFKHSQNRKKYLPKPDSQKYTVMTLKKYRVRYYIDWERVWSIGIIFSYFFRISKIRDKATCFFISQRNNFLFTSAISKYSTISKKLNQVKQEPIKEVITSQRISYYLFIDQVINHQKTFHSQKKMDPPKNIISIHKIIEGVFERKEKNISIMLLSIIISIN